MAEARYDELLTCHQDAFADHAAEFWLTLGGDPGRALRLARQNLSLRQTPRAHTLVRLCACAPIERPAIVWGSGRGNLPADQAPVGCAGNAGDVIHRLRTGTTTIDRFP